MDVIPAPNIVKPPATNSDVGNHIEVVARELLGAPNRHLSTNTELRFGTHGSVSVEIRGDKLGTWYDHEAKVGGGVLDLLRIKGGLTNGAAAEWLRNRGIDFGQPAQVAPAGKWKFIADYHYEDEHGETKFRVIRWLKPDNTKSFSQERANGAGWVKGRGAMNGVTLLPYHLTEVLSAVGNQVILIVEGEKDVDNLRKLGFTATCNPGGAGKWPAHFDQYFRGADVVVLADNDQAGRDHAQLVASSLDGFANTICLLNMPMGTPEKGDISWWIEQGTTADQIRAMLDAAEPFGLGDAWEAPGPAEQEPDTNPKQNQNPNWYSLCQVSSKGTPLGNHANIMLALREDPAWADIVCYDEMARVIMLMKPLPKIPAQKANGKFKPRPWQDNDATVAQEWFQLAGLTSAAREAIYYAIEARARENASHPVQNYLNGLFWDGVPRLNSWLPNYIGTEDTAYTQAIGRLFLISSVARILDPGCKVDYMLILEGDQGESKSTACKVLGGEWFSDNMPHDVSSKDASQHLRGKWFIEVAEMHAMSKSETTALKAFLTRTVEVYRPSYGRAEVYEPRQCVFIGTTNRDDYLDDETGARRFWPVRVGSIDIDGLKRDRDQLFAEAVHCYHAGEQWYPSRDFEAEFIRPQQEARYNVDAWDEPIMKWLNTEKPVTLSNGATTVRATAMEIATLALGLDVGRVDKAATNRIRKVLSSNGWHKDGPRNNAGNRPWYPGSFPRQKK